MVSVHVSAPEIYFYFLKYFRVTTGGRQCINMYKRTRPVPTQGPLQRNRSVLENPWRPDCSVTGTRKQFLHPPRQKRVCPNGGWRNPSSTAIPLRAEPMPRHVTLWSPTPWSHFSQPDGRKLKRLFSENLMRYCSFRGEFSIYFVCEVWQENLKDKKENWHRLDYFSCMQRFWWSKWQKSKTVWKCQMLWHIWNKRQKIKVQKNPDV